MYNNILDVFLLLLNFFINHIILRYSMYAGI